MKSLIYYLLQVIITSGILYTYYHWALRNKKFHQYNRFYLLAAFVISILIPFVNIPVYLSHTETDSSFILQTLTSISTSVTEEPESSTIYSPIVKVNWFTWQNLVCVLYILIAFFVLLRVLFSLRRIRLIIHNNPVEKLENISFVNTNEPGTPFSFFRWLFWNRQIELNSEKGEQVFRHELFHIEQRHSRDIIFMELMMVVFWINPFFHLFKKEVKAIHEFLADQFAIDENNKWGYAELLLMQALGSNQHLVNPFFHNQIKRRIAMITSSKNPGHQYLRKLAVLPIAAIVVGLFAFSYKNKNERSRLFAIDKPINVVIDAGHGMDATGKYNGVKATDGSYEDDIVLAVAKKIKELNTNDRLHITLTREDKKLVELSKRVEFANSQNPDLFISLHTSVASRLEKDKSGMDIYVSAKNTTNYAENKILATILYNYFSQIHPVNKIKQSEAGIYVIDNSNCPSALVELGYISNQEDLAFMKSANGQEKIANSILQSIEQYILQSEGEDWGERKRIVSNTTKPEIKLVTDPVSGEKNLIIDGRKVTGIIMSKETNQYGLITEEGSMEVISKEQSNEITSKYGDVIKGLLLKNEITKKDEPDNKIFEKVEIEPSFPGGNKEWKNFLERNLDKNIPVKKGCNPGTYTVIIQFIVRKDGSITDVKALTKYGFGMEEEAIRIIKKGPHWVPAIQNGKNVNAYRKQPITFQVAKVNNKTSQINISQLNEVVVTGFREGKGRYPKDSKVPSFVGGEKEWRVHLERNVNAMVAVDNGAPVGTYITVTQFLVNADGTTSEFKSLTNQGYGMEEEALRVIKGATQWEPAVVNGEKVSAYKKQPVTFVITIDGSDKPSLTKTSLPKPNADQLPPIYPNPSNNFVAIPINSQLEGKGEITITDINGVSKMIIPTSFAKGTNNLRVNIASLAKGTYIVNVIDASKKIVSAYKMVKQ